MIYPTTEELSQGKYNKYVLVAATAKCAHLVTEEYCRMRERVERQLVAKDTDKSIAAPVIDKEIRDEKAVRCAIKRLHNGDYRIIDESVPSLGENS